MQKITTTVTRKWIKDLRAKGMSNKDIIIYATSKKPVDDTTDMMGIFADLQLAGVIAED